MLFVSKKLYCCCTGIMIYVFYNRTKTKGLQNLSITTFRYFTTCAIKPGLDKNLSMIKY